MSGFYPPILAITEVKTGNRPWFPNIGQTFWGWIPVMKLWKIYLIYINSWIMYCKFITLKKLMPDSSFKLEKLIITFVVARKDSFILHLKIIKFFSY